MPLITNEGLLTEQYCEKCGFQSTHLIDTCSQTFYCWDEIGEDPNRNLLLCEYCSDEYSEEMESQWQTYYNSVL